MKRKIHLTITGTEHGEWQGVVRTADGQETAFLSVPELIRAISRVLEEK